MDGTLSLSEGVLWVARGTTPAHLQAYDLDGRALSPGFDLPREERLEPRGLSVDADRRLWLVDARTGTLSAWSIFGLPLARLAEPEDRDLDRPGRLGHAVDVEASGVEDELELVVATGGWRRHALQCVRQDGALIESLRPLGDPEGEFRGLCAVAARGRTLFACEGRAGRIQVFRERHFHYALELPAGSRGSLEPRAVAPLGDGRLVVAVRGASSGLLLLDAGGKLLLTLAPEGAEEGRVLEPGDVVVEEGVDDRHARVAVIDLGGERIQAFNLEGTCFGSFVP